MDERKLNRVMQQWRQYSGDNFTAAAICSLTSSAASQQPAEPGEQKPTSKQLPVLPSIESESLASRLEYGQ
jgi:hypothetical protein